MHTSLTPISVHTHLIMHTHLTPHMYLCVHTQLTPLFSLMVHTHLCSLTHLTPLSVHTQLSRRTPLIMHIRLCVHMQLMHLTVPCVCACSLYVLSNTCTISLAKHIQFELVCRRSSESDANKIN